MSTSSVLSAFAYRALGELAEGTTRPDTREPLDTAHDATLRALDVVEAAAVAATPAPSSGHHRSRRRGCGH